MENQCYYCKFFYQKIRSEHNIGECRHDSPWLGADHHESAEWPTVSSDKWCGEFEMRYD